jgi:hypothetical protein
MMTLLHIFYNNDDFADVDYSGDEEEEEEETVKPMSNGVEKDGRRRTRARAARSVSETVAMEESVAGPSSVSMDGLSSSVSSVQTQINLHTLIHY